MKKVIVILFLSLTMHVELTAQGIPVMDIAHIAMTVANGAVLKDQLNVLSEQVILSQKIEEKVTSIYQLQYDYRESLKQAETVADLQWADLVESQSQAMALKTNFDAYVPDFENIETLKKAYQNLEKIEGAVALYEQLDGFGAGSTLPQSYYELEQMLQQLSLNRYAFDEMAYKKKLQVALSYNQIADDLLAKSQQLSEALLVNDRFSMTEAERLTSLKQAQDYMIQSMDLKLASDNLIQHVMQESEKTKGGPLKQYQQQLERHLLSATPLND